MSEKLRRIVPLAIGLSVICYSVAMAEQSDDVSVLDARTGMTDWVDPVKAVPSGCGYVTYPSPHRGDGTEASCLVYLPPSYGEDTGSRYPVIYYLHGGTGNQREVKWLVARADSLIRRGEMNPVIIVSPQALPIGWYVNANTSDAKVQSGPIEDVIVKDLIPFVDGNYRTLPQRESRGIEGFSMGGRGALMLAFKHPDLFGAVSSVAGAVVDWDEEPLQRALECTFGDAGNELSRVYFNAWHPITFACQNRGAIIDSGMKIRMFVGDSDRLFNDAGNHITERFHSRLDSLGIPHDFHVVPGANHNPVEVFDANVNPYDGSFWNKAFEQARVEVPDTLVRFAAEHFPGDGIAAFEELPDERGTHYLLTMADGSEVKFNEHFKWIKVAAPAGKPVPESLVHAGIASHLGERGIEHVAVIEKVPRVGYDVMLDNGDRLIFDTGGNPIHSN